MVRFRHLRALMIAVAAAVPLAACDDDDPLAPDDGTAMLRIVNAARGTSNIDVVQLGSDTPIATLDFRETTEQCLEVPAGNTAFSFRVGGGEFAATLGTLEEGSSNMLFIVGTGASVPRRAILASDEQAVAAGMHGLRFINVTSTVGDVHVTTPTGTPGAATRVVGNLFPLAPSNATLEALLNVPVERTRVRLFESDATTNPRADITLTGVPASRMATVVFTEAGATLGDRAFVIFPCD